MSVNGSDTITAGNTYVDVPHGLGYTPNTDDIYVTPNDNLGGRSFWKSDIGSSTFRINISSMDLVDHTFSYTITLTGVGCNDVRDVIHITSTDIPDAKIAKMLKRAEVTLELETGEEIDYTDCTDAQKEFITILAAMYAVCYLTGGSAIGLNITIGDLRSEVVRDIPSLSVMKAHLDELLEKLRTPYVGRV